MRGETIIVSSSSRRICKEVHELLGKTRCEDTIYEVYTTGNFQTAVKKYHPRLVLLETNCWYEATAYMIAQYAEEFPAMSIAAFGYERLTPAKAVGFINLGAASYVDLRLDDEAELSQAFSLIVRDKIYLPEWVAKAVKTYSLALPECPALSKCEILVLRLAGLGNGIEDIAVKLRITRGTVRNHISSVHRKFNIHTQAEMTGLALRVRIVLPEELVTEEIDIQVLEKEVQDIHAEKKIRRV
jgi:DNA-binding NarL/FixJ family response regulator